MEKLERIKIVKKQIADTGGDTMKSVEDVEKLLATGSEAAINEHYNQKKEKLRFELYKLAQTCTIIADELKEDG